MSRIDDLINTVPTDTSGRWVNVKDLPALVELIVRECIDVTLRNFELESSYSRIVKKHFGVEE